MREFRCIYCDDVRKSRDAIRRHFVVHHEADLIYTTNSDGSHCDRVIHPSLEYLNSRRAAYRLTPLRFLSLANHSLEFPGDVRTVVLLPPERASSVPLSNASPDLKLGESLIAAAETGCPPDGNVAMLQLSSSCSSVSTEVNNLGGWIGMEPDDYPSGFIQIGFEELEPPCFLEAPVCLSSSDCRSITRELSASPGYTVGGQPEFDMCGAIYSCVD